MAVIQNEETSLVDTAVGPFKLTTTQYAQYDIDDYVHDVVIGQATQLRLYNIAVAADKRYMDNRLPVNVGDVQVGGYVNV